MFLRLKIAKHKQVDTEKEEKGKSHFPPEHASTHDHIIGLLFAQILARKIKSEKRPDQRDLDQGNHSTQECVFSDVGAGLKRVN